MIRVSHLTKEYGRHRALSDVSFSVAQGEIAGLLGPNGAGKSTILRILACYLPATGGSVEVAGHDVFSESLQVRARIGYLPESVPLYLDMRVTEYLRYRAGLKGLRGRRRRDRVRAVIEACALQDVRREVVGRLSKGFRQRVGLADALVHEPDVLILDEPSIGLDPNQIRQMRTLIRGLAHRHTVLLSSHILSEVEMICDRVFILNRGEIVADGSAKDLEKMVAGNPRIVLEVRGEEEKVFAGLSAVDGVERVVTVTLGDWVRATCVCGKEGDTRPALFRAVVAGGWELREMARENSRLEDVFAKMTGEET